jgi:hypothetical protein
MNLALPNQGLNPLGLGFTLVVAVLIFILPRTKALVPFLALVCFMTLGERLVIGGLNFTMFRVVLLFGIARIALRGGLPRKFNLVDKLVLAWVAVRTMNYTLVFGSSAALINRLGYALDILGAYFLFRALVREPEDVYRAVRWLGIFFVPLAGLMTVEKLTGQNPFAVFGGVPLISEIRNGTIRCQGPFSHSILAGTFAATAVPLFWGLWSYRRSARPVAFAGVAAATLIVVLCGSSGPVLAYAGAVLGLACWSIRRSMKLARWGAVLALIGLQFVMNSPIWFVLARLTVFSGSTGWFRGFLMDMAFNHLNEWWLYGSSAAPTWHPFLIDVTNQYLAEGFDGGLPALGLFIAILAYSFGFVGRFSRVSEATKGERLLVWSAGAALGAHALSFLSVSYFDQTLTLYLLTVVAAGSGLLYAKQLVPTETAVESEQPQLTDSDPVLQFQ